MMERIRLSSFLRGVLFADAATSAAAALLLTAGADSLEHALGIPVALLRYSGVSFIPFAAFVTYVATREAVSRAVVWAVVAANALWAVDSIVMVLAGLVAPTRLGVAFVIAQALVVAAFAEAEYVGLRRCAAPAAQ